MKKNSLLSRSLEFLPYAAYRVLAALVCALPIEAGFIFGRLLGSVAYRIAVPMRRQALLNLHIAYGGEKSEQEIRSLALAHFAHLGANLFSSIKLASMPRERLDDLITVEIPQETLGIGKDESRGWLAMISHLGCWEVFAQLGELIPNHPMAAVYRPLPNRYLEAHWQRSRAKHGVSLFDRRRELIKAHRFLKEGGAVGVLVDQHAGDAGVWAPFFGRLASTSPLAASLAVRADVPIVPIAVQTVGLARWRVVVAPPIDTKGGDPNQLTAEINRAFEAQVRASPADWLWSHNRWKTPQPRFLLGSFHRGVVYPLGFEGSLKPFRILVVSPADPVAARASVPAIELISPYRPDAEVVVLTPPELESFWLETEAVARVIVDSGPALARDVRSLGHIDAAILFSAEQRHSRALHRAGVPRLVGYRVAHPAANQGVLQKCTDAQLPEYYIDLVVNAGARDSRGC